MRPRHLILAAILLLSFGLRSCHLANHLASPLGSIEDVSAITDIGSFAVWAHKMVDAGDWLCVDTHHSYFDWMKDMAPLSQFLEWWGGEKVYHQQPLYAYLLAFSYLLFASSTPLLILQILLSVAALLVIYDLGRRMLDVRCGLIAAAIAGLYAPSILYDTFVLRASLTSSLNLLTLWLIYVLIDAIRGGAGQRKTVGLALATGLCLGSGFMLRPTGLLLIVCTPVVFAAMPSIRGAWRQWGTAIAAGLVLTIGPFVARNLIVGAPAFAFSTRGPETILQANTRGMDPGFMSLPTKDEFVEFMKNGHGSLLRALSTAIDSWPEDGPLSWWLWHMWQKVVCVVSDYEYGDNVNFYFYQDLTWAMPWLPTFGWFVGLGLVGLGLLARRGRDRHLLWLPAAALLAIAIGCVLGFAINRYRLPLAIMLTIPAAATISLGIEWARQRRYGVVLSCALAATAISTFAFVALPQRAYFLPGDKILYEKGEMRRFFRHSMTYRAQEYHDLALALHAEDQTAEAKRRLADYRSQLQVIYDEQLRRIDALTAAQAIEDLERQHLLTSARAMTKFHLEHVAKAYDKIGDKDGARATRRQLATFSRPQRRR